MATIKGCYSQFKEKDFLLRQIPELSRLLVRRTDGQNIWSKSNVPKNWPSYLTWKNPTSVRKDTMDELKHKFDWLRDEARSQGLLSKEKSILFDLYARKINNTFIDYAALDKLLTDIRKFRKDINCDKPIELSIDQFLSDKEKEILASFSETLIESPSNDYLDIKKRTIQPRINPEISSPDTSHSIEECESSNSTNFLRADEIVTKTLNPVTQNQSVSEENCIVEQKQFSESNKNSSEAKRKNSLSCVQDSHSDNLKRIKLSPQDVMSNSQSPTDSGLDAAETIERVSNEENKKERTKNMNRAFNLENLLSSSGEANSEGNFNPDDDLNEDCGDLFRYVLGGEDLTLKEAFHTNGVNSNDITNCTIDNENNEPEKLLN